MQRLGAWTDKVIHLHRAGTSPCIVQVEVWRAKGGWLVEIERAKQRPCCSLKAFSVTILSIVGHAGEVERTFFDLSTTQSARQCNLSVDPFEILGKLRRLGSPPAIDMHTREEVSIAVETARYLEASFAWAPPPSTEPRNADDLLAGPESISPDDIAAEFTALEELNRTEEVQRNQNINEVEVLEGNAIDFDE
ncbi:hypothetical protein BDR03DRAFT_1017099 [Suillus americanus]|nr:hypothetical protein BDR03DRAFT_1017099 [Suillus americanus]